VSEQRPRVDIGMPTRGAAPYLDEAIGSVTAQTYGSWSLFISENGPGELRERVEPYLGDSRIRFSPTGEDLGAARNHTRLIQEGDAPYVAILHDDDRWDPEWLERRVDFLEQHPECGFVFGGNREIDERSQVTSSSELVLSEGVHASREVVPQLVGHNLVGIPTVLVRRSAYEAVGPEFTEETVSFDYEMWLRLALRFPVGYLAVRDADYRVHSGQVTMTNRKRGEDQIRLVERIRSLVAEAPGIEGDERGLRRRLARAHLSAALDALQGPDRPGARRHLQAALKEYPPSALDPRAAGVVAGFVLGRRGRRALDRARYLVLRKCLRVHLRR
jgi:glycosyltransferase involved in cell wall biosynthesis